MNTLQKKLIQILNDNQYHAGETIENLLGMTRSGVRKLVKNLINLGFEIDSINNLGYRLLNKIELLNLKIIKQNVGSPFLNEIKKWDLFDEITSTNDFLLTEVKNKVLTNRICLAEKQTIGRGRLGRNWVSPYAQNIYLSYCKIFNCLPSSLSGLNIVVGIALIDALKSIFPNLDVKLKWPNDLYVKNKKIGGILMEISGEFNHQCAVIIGIGLNVMMTHHQQLPITKPWTSLTQVTNGQVSRNILAGRIIEHLIKNILLFEKEGLSHFLNVWKQVDLLFGKKIKVRNHDKTIDGVATGVNQYGQLNITNDNNICTVSAGEVTILEFESSP